MVILKMNKFIFLGELLKPDPDLTLATRNNGSVRF